MAMVVNGPIACPVGARSTARAQTRGAAIVHGRVARVFDLGAGMDPEISALMWIDHGTVRIAGRIGGVVRAHEKYGARGDMRTGGRPP